VPEASVRIGDDAPSSQVRGDSLPSREGDGALVYRSERGDIRISLMAPRVMLFKYSGYADVRHVDFVESVFDATFGNCRRIELYVDCEQQTGHDAGFRVQIVRWARRVHPQTRTYLILVRSRIVGFGVALANGLVGGHATAVTCREAFSAQLDRSIRRSFCEHDDCPTQLDGSP
jgi:hypothetical protein